MYIKRFGLRLTGTIMTGPNAGRQFINYNMDIFENPYINDDDISLHNAIEKAKQHISSGQFIGTIEVYSKQYIDKKRGFEYVVIETITQ